MQFRALTPALSPRERELYFVLVESLAAVNTVSNVFSLPQIYLAQF